MAQPAPRGPTALHTASWDYRMVDSQRASVEADAAHDQPMALAHIDQPGAYAYETAEQVARLAEVQLQAPVEPAQTVHGQRHRAHHGTRHHVRVV